MSSQKSNFTGSCRISNSWQQSTNTEQEALLQDIRICIAKYQRRLISVQNEFLEGMFLLAYQILIIQDHFLGWAKDLGIPHRIALK